MIYVALGFAALCIAALLFVTRWGMKAKDQAGNASDRMHSQGKLDAEAMAVLVDERDRLKYRVDVLLRQLAVAKVRLATAEDQRNKARREERAHVVESIRDSATAISALRGVLSDQLPGMSQAGQASPGDGDSGAAGVQPAGPAGANTGTGRLPKP